MKKPKKVQKTKKRAKNVKNNKSILFLYYKLGLYHVINYIFLPFHKFCIKKTKKCAKVNQKYLRLNYLWLISMYKLYIFMP